MHGPTRIFWANLTSFSLSAHTRRGCEFHGGHARARSHCLLGLGRPVALYYLLILFIPESLTYSVPLFLKRQCDRTLGLAPPEHRGALPEPPGAVELGRALRAAPSVRAIRTPETVPGAPEIHRNRSKDKTRFQHKNPDCV
jgi:hypothetical protein